MTYELRNLSTEFSRFKDVRKLNQEISESYKSLRQSNSVVSTRTLSQLGLFPRSGPLKHFCKLLFAMHNSLERNKREETFRQINETREYKTRLVNQLRFLDWQRKSFLKEVEEMKQKRTELRREFYRNRYQYERTLLIHNFDFFMKVIQDTQRKKQYYAATKQLWQKRRARTDSSKELEFIKYLDLEARRVFNIQGIKSTQEEPLKKPISDYMYKPDDDKPNRGIRR